MAELREWFSGIFVALIGSLIFYFYWENIFLGMINFIGDFGITGVTDASSIQILKTIAWVDFIFIYIFSVPFFLIYSIVVGSGTSGVKTNPLEIFKAIGVYLISLPFSLIVYVILASLVTSLTTATTDLMDASSLTIAGQFSWLIGLIVILIISLLPFYFILKGYGQLAETT